MKRLVKILLSIMMLGVVIPLWLTGFQQIRQHGLIGAFEPMANNFGVSPISLFITVFIICLIVIFILSYPFLLYIKERNRLEQIDDLAKKEVQQ